MIAQSTKKMGVALAVLFSSAGIAWASCGGTEGLVNAAVGRLSSVIVAQLATTTTALVAADTLQAQQMVSSLRVITKQIQTSGEQYNNATIESEKSMANVSKDLADKELIDQIVLDFMSQGFEPCTQSAATKRLATAERSVYTSVPQRVRTEIEAGGGRYMPVAESLRARERAHQRLFCTQEEVEAGVCSSVGRIPGGDANAALIFSTDRGADMVAAKNAVINNIIGLPDEPLTPAAAATPEGQAYMMEKKKKDSFLSFAAYSLKSIQTENEQYKAEMDDRVGQFFGTDRAAAWARDQAGQSSRGVLIDMLKIQGLTLKVRERRIRQNLRTEANLAALLELENQQTNGEQTQNAVKQINAINASQKVR